MKGLTPTRGGLQVWTTALSLAVSVCICHGIGRFSYALVLPAMQESLRWSYEVASWLNTANSLGYIVGSLASLVLLRGINAGRVFRIGVGATVASVFLTGVWDAWWWLLAMRLVAGCGAAFAFSSGGAIVA
ncbi:YbfB/YjiJ family MFS transporter, partial [Streptococcus pyogenes]|uniref:YbfB/YjiJ family MFS transporter n=1 Tax=Streptococcus pyogenes TaxID=1314 RepID=UPI003DA14A0C